MLRNSLISTHLSLLAIPLTLGLSGACGDDDGGQPDAQPDSDAAPNIDAADPTPDSGTDGNAGDGGGGGISSELFLAEIYFDHPRMGDVDNDEFQWIKLYNSSDTAIDLSGYSLGWGGPDYTFGTLQLSGTIGPKSCFVIGGPNSVPVNGEPTYDQVVDYEPDLQVGGDQCDGVALFDIPADQIQADTVPIDVAVYGGNDNASNLIDETGMVSDVNIGEIDPSQSIQRFADGSWEENITPTPSVCPPFVAGLR